KAVIATHLYGKLCDMDRIIAIARKHGAVVIEDCAQSHGAKRNGRTAGAFGDMAAFSFYPTKNLGAFGDGGALTTSDSKFADKLKALGQYGWAERYNAQTPGGRNTRLDEMQAAILRVLLPHLTDWNARRREIAQRTATAARRARSIQLAPAYGEDHAA